MIEAFNNVIRSPLTTKLIIFFFVGGGGSISYILRGLKQRVTLTFENDEDTNPSISVSDPK